MEYSYNKKPVGRTARARVSRVNCSWKDLGEVCRNVRGKDTEHALGFLGAAAEGKQAIHFRRHAKSKGHRRELGGKQGGFPVKSVRAVLNVLQSANANANKLGLGATRIAHLVSNKHATYPRMSPKGRRIRHDYEVAFIEIVLEELQQKAEKKEEVKKPEVKKADVPKKAEAPKKEEVKKEEKKVEEEKKPEAKKEEAPKPAEKKVDAPKKVEEAKKPEVPKKVDVPKKAEAPMKEEAKKPEAAPKKPEPKKQDDIIMA